MADFNHEYARAFFFRPEPQRDKNTACLLIHGFTGSPGHMRLIGKALCDSGYTVSGILLPGHASSIDDMEKTTWIDWLRAARDAAHELRRNFKRVYIGGLSMGGTLSIILAEEGLSDCLLSFAAPILIHNRFAPLSSYFWPLYRKSKWEKNNIEGFKTEYDYGYMEAPVRRVGDLLRLIKLSRAGLSRIICPAFIVQSPLDETVKPQSAQIIYDGIATPKKELLWLERSGHVCTIGPETDIILEKLLAFLDSVDGQYDDMKIIT